MISKCEVVFTIQYSSAASVHFSTAFRPKIDPTFASSSLRELNRQVFEVRDSGRVFAFFVEGADPKNTRNARLPNVCFFEGLVVNICKVLVIDTRTLAKSLQCLHQEISIHTTMESSWNISLGKRPWFNKKTSCLKTTCPEPYNINTSHILATQHSFLPIGDLKIFGARHWLSMEEYITLPLTSSD